MSFYRDVLRGKVMAWEMKIRAKGLIGRCIWKSSNPLEERFSHIVGKSRMSRDEFRILIGRARDGFKLEFQSLLSVICLELPEMIFREIITTNSPRCSWKLKDAGIKRSTKNKTKELCRFMREKIGERKFIFCEHAEGGPFSMLDHFIWRVTNHQSGLFLISDRSDRIEWIFKPFMALTFERFWTRIWLLKVSDFVGSSFAVIRPEWDCTSFLFDILKEFARCITTQMFAPVLCCIDRKRFDHDRSHLLKPRSIIPHQIRLREGTERGTAFKFWHEAMADNVAPFCRYYFH
jgi:hypothetical protein